MKKNIFALISLLILSASVSYAELPNVPTCTSQQNCNLYKMMYAQRATVYNALNLTTEQKEDLEKCEQERFAKLQNLYCELEQEQFLLNQMKTGETAKSAVIRQQKSVRRITKDIDEINEKYDRNFIKKLSSEQSKYNERNIIM